MARNSGEGQGGGGGGGSPTGAAGGDLGGNYPNPTVPHLAPVFNVKSAPFNAVGNGVADDSTAIQAAITACQTAGGGIVYLPIGTYLLTAAGLLVGGTGVTVQGAGEYATTIQVATNASITPLKFSGAPGGVAATPGVVATYAYAGVVRDLTVKMAGPATGANATPGIRFEYYVLPKQINVTILNFALGLNIASNYNNAANRVGIIMGTATTNYGFKIDSTNGINASADFRNCFAVGEGGGTSYGWYYAGGIIDDLFMDYCEGDTCTYGLAIDGTGGQGQDLHISHFIADSCTNGMSIINVGTCVDIEDPWILIGSGGTGIILNNTHNASVRAAKIKGTSNAAGISVTNCDMTALEANAITGTFTNGIINTGSTNTSLVGNKVKGSGAGTITTGVNIAAGSAHVKYGENNVDTSGTVTTPFAVATGLTDITGINNGGLPDSVPGATLGTVYYAPTTLANFAVTAALTALDTTNLTIAFVVPPSGAVDILLQAECQAVVTTVAGSIAFGLLNHSGGAQVGDTVNVIGWGTPSAASLIGYPSALFHLTGLTPGPMQLDFAAGITTASMAGNVFGQAHTGAPSGGNANPFVMQARAA